MSKFTVSYTIEAEDLSEAGRIAHENVYWVDVEPEEVRVRQAEGSSQIFRTFNEPAQKIPAVREVDDLEGFIPKEVHNIPSSIR